MPRATKYQEHRLGVLLEIRSSNLKHSKSPTVRDLADQFDVGVATMHSYLQKLSDEGMVEWRRGRHRTLSLSPQGLQEVSSSVRR